MSRHQNAGILVRTSTGKLGIIYNRDAKALDDPAGRAPVTLLDEQYQPIMGEDNNPKCLLCQPAGLTTIGFFD